MAAWLRGISARVASFRIMPLALFAVMPLLAVRVKYAAVAPDAAWLWPTYALGDLRGWWKAALVVGLASWMAFFTGARLLTGWRPRNRNWGILTALAILVALASAMLSPFSATVWIGYTTQYEGALVLFAYMAAAWYAAEMTDGPAERRWLVRILGMAALLNACHGIAEGFGCDPWQTGLGRWLMGAGAQEVTYRFAESRFAYGTVFQPNHYGMLMAMTGALALGMGFRDSGKTWRAFWLMTSCLCLAAALSSHSRAGVIVLAGVSAAFAARYVYCAFRGAPRFRLRTAVVPILLIALPLFATETFRRTVSQVWTRVWRVAAPAPVTGDVRAVGLTDDCIRIYLADRVVALDKPATDAWRIGVEDGERMLLSAKPRPEGWRLTTLPDIEGGRLLFRRRGNVRLVASGIRLDFFAVGTRIWAVDAPSRMLYAELPPFFYEPSGHEGILTRRGYIWRRVFDVAWKSPFLGSGPGTFALVFPNRDLLNKRRFISNLNEDKGHGIWATFLVQMGLLGVTAFALPVIYAVYRGMKTGGILVMPLVSGILAFALCAVTNDSTVGVTPIFCVIVGLVIAETTERPIVRLP